MQIIHAALLCAVFSSAAEAATFYYVSGPYARADYDVAETPIMTTGILEIDETKLPGGLAGAVVSNERNFDALVRATFGNSAGSHTKTSQTLDYPWRFTFDSAGKVASTAFCQYCAQGEDDGWYIFDKDPWSPFQTDSVDTNRPLPQPGRLGGHFVSFGQWFDDPLEWASEIQRNAAYSAANPPSNRFHDAPAPVPLPAAAWLLIGGLGLLGGLKGARRLRA